MKKMKNLLLCSGMVLVLALAAGCGDASEKDDQNGTVTEDQETTDETTDENDTMDENTSVKIEIDPEKLYFNMVEAKAEWLFGLPQWDSILTEEKKKELYKKQKASGTIVKGPKIGRNDPCPCGSGKKYKKCCGKNA